jgi:hypothetical protein
VLVLILSWAIVAWAFYPPRQSQLIALAPLSATILLALNQSAIHVGAAAGSAAGALTLIHAVPAALGAAAASLTIIALAALVAKQRRSKIGNGLLRFKCARPTGAISETRQAAKFLKEDPCSIPNTCQTPRPLIVVVSQVDVRNTPLGQLQGMSAPVKVWRIQLNVFLLGCSSCNALRRRALW